MTTSLQQTVLPILAAFLLVIGSASAQCGGNGGAAVLNTSPQAIGTTVTVSLSGNAGAPFSIYLSGGLTTLLFPGFGTVCVDPLDPFFGEFVSGSIPAGGRYDLALPIPPDPALLSFVVYLQGVAVDGGHPSGLGLSRAVRVDFESPDAHTALPPLLSPRALAASAVAGDGRLLITGGGAGSLLAPSGTTTTEIFDSLTRTIVPGPLMGQERAGHTATTLLDGRVLIAGGADGSIGAVTASCEIFDPVTDTITPAAPMGTPRAAHTATLLADGRVLVAGGTTTFQTSPTGSILPILNGALNTAEIYDPVTGTWSPAAGTMSSKRMLFAAVRQPGGQVMMIAGVNGGTTVTIPFVGSFDLPTFTASCDFFDPSTNTFSAAPSLGSARGGHSAALHAGTGKTLVAGGIRITGFIPVPTIVSSTRVFNGTSWSNGPSLPVGVAVPAMVPLADGRIHISGGAAGTLTTSSFNLYGVADSVTWDGGASFTTKAPLLHPAASHVAALLPDGQVFIAGGVDGTGVVVDGAGLYTPDP